MIPNAYRGKLREALNEGGSETIIYVDSLETINGETLDFSKFTPYRGILTIDPYGEYPEWVSFTGINTTNNSFTGVTRGLSALDNTVVTGNKFFHSEETDVVLTWGVHNGLDIPDGAVDSVNSQTGAVVLDADDIDDTSTTHKFVTAGDITKLGGLFGTNTGDQTSIVGITGTTAQFNTALTDGDFATLAGSETLTNKTLTSPTLSGNITHQGGIITVGGDLTNTGAIQLQPADPTYNWYSWVNKETGSNQGIALQRGSYPSVVSTPFSITAAGAATFTGSITATGGTFSSTLIPAIIQGGGGAGSTTTANAQYLSSTSTGYHWRTGIYSPSLSANQNVTSVNILRQTITEAATGTHALIANLAVGAPEIVEGAGSTTNAATVYIEGAPTGTATITNKYALWVDSGNVRIDNSTTAPSTTSAGTVTNRYGGATNFLGDPTGWLTINVDGTDRKIPFY
jgi:hypothetical protein